MPAPANDDLANAQVITGTSGTVTGSNVSATAETDEVTYLTVMGGVTIWYAWTAPASGTAAFDTYGSRLPSTETLDTVIDAWDDTAGATFATLTFVDRNDEAGTEPINSVTFGTTSRMVFHVTAGVTYYVRIDGYDSSQQGSTVLNWSLTVPPPTPTITGFSPASARTGDTVTVTGTGFVAITAVQVAGHAVTFTVVNSTTITFIAGHYEGTISVFNSGGTGTSGTGLLLTPWVQLLASLDNVTESRDVNTSSTHDEWRFTGCALTDSLALLAYVDVIGGTSPGRVRPVTVGASSLSTGTPATFDLLGQPQGVLLSRLDDTHALIAFVDVDAVTHVTMSRVAVVTVSGTSVSVSPSWDVANTGPLVGLSGSLGMWGPNNLIHVSGGLITAVDDLSAYYSGVNFGSSGWVSMVRLSGTRVLALKNDVVLGDFKVKATVIDVTGGVPTVGTQTRVGSDFVASSYATSGWMRADGTVVQWWQGPWYLLVVDPNGMSGPTAVQTAPSSSSAGLSAFGFGFSVADLTDDPTMLLVPTDSGVTLEVFAGPTALDVKVAPLVLPGVEILSTITSSGNGELLRFAGRSLLLATDATTHYGLLRLVAPDLPVTTGGWAVGMIRIG